MTGTGQSANACRNQHRISGVVFDEERLLKRLTVRRSERFGLNLTKSSFKGTLIEKQSPQPGIALDGLVSYQILPEVHRQAGHPNFASSLRP